ncbi:hypothetical protein [Herbiconiux solani]|uniref:hypothetical protein n=1 Tax=Herbiconiux solani TaxID=661329 RepID=UPI00082436C1|nr:hypothetical protein [Herbiconiux solani]
MNRPGAGALLGAIALGSVLVLSGCMTSADCPATTWTNAASVTLNGDVTSVDHVELCAGDSCSAYGDGTGTPTPSPGADPSKTPYTATRVDDHDWRITTKTDTPDTVTVRAYDAVGHVLMEKTVSLTWKQVGGTPECGGQHTAPPVRFDIG